ncbi:MAG: hypothetical protein H6737_17900 [Alphaproteobacteria bacterium]|nr:hypothetical protein [Alphaproteobacteria bacterium]
MSRSLVSFSVLFAAVVSSIATSAPAWTVSDRETGKLTLDRGDALELGIELFATGDALPDVEGGFAPQGGSGEGGLVSDLDVELEIATVGTLGFNRVDTTVTVELWMDTDEGDWLVDEAEVDVLAGEPVAIELGADGVFAGCPTGEDCQRALTVVLTQTDDAKLRVKHTARLFVRAPLVGPAPDTAVVEVAVDAL